MLGVVGLAGVVAGGCAAGSLLGRHHPDMRALAGVWVDSTKATPADTVAWKLDPNGADWTLEIRVKRDSATGVATERRETRYGYWYLEGALADTAGRAICIKIRPRDGGTCYPFTLDTISGTQADARPRRRLVIAGYRGQQHTRTRVLIERFP